MSPAVDNEIRNGVPLHVVCAGLPVGPLPPENPPVRGVCHDSRRVEPGDLYVALAGQHHDGRDFVGQAVARGAIAALGAGAAPAGLAVPWIEAENPRALLGELAGRVHGRPHERLEMLGVTGTNGKSTVVHLLAGILEAAGRPAGVLGTLGYRFAGRSFLDAPGGGYRTTPEAPDLQRVLRRMAEAGVRAAAMEVSSHGLVLERTSGLLFDVAVFTNLSQDHLDFHGDMESYFAAKQLLFERLKSHGRAVVGLGDEYGRRLAARFPEALTFGLDDGDVRVLDAELDEHGTRVRLVTPRGELGIRSPLVGRFNLWNLLAAVAAGEALELPAPAIAAGLAVRQPLAGRLEPVRAGQSFPVFVDYAHTPAALASALASLREISRHRLLVVFGCGGDRDRGKRPQMGRIAGEGADLAILTSDNPRSEDPRAILAEVEAGLAESGGIHESFVDRRQAIRRAVEIATADPGLEWMILVAGKGHEEKQIIGSREIPFSDRGELLAALAEHGFKEESGDG